MQRQFVAALSALALIVLATPAAAQNARDAQTVSMTVRHGDLNLEDQAGARALVARINRAARMACGGRPFAREIVAIGAVQDCVRDASSRAVADVGRPIVTAEYIARGGGRTTPPIVAASSN